MIFKRAALAVSLLVLSFSAHADSFGALSGRSANPANSAPLSVEGSLILGGGFNTFGARINYVAGDALTIYGDLALADRGFNDGFAFGIGAFYYLQGVSANSGLDFALQGSFHLLGSDETTIDFHVLVSPKEPINPDTGLGWYATGGLSRFSADVGPFTFSDTDIALGAGVYLPVSAGQLYGGIELNDGVNFGVGYRYGLN